MREHPTTDSPYNQRPNGHIPNRPAANAPINIVLQYKDKPEQGAGRDRILSLRTPGAGGPHVRAHGKGVWQSRFYYSVEKERRDRHGRKLPRNDTKNSLSRYQMLRRAGARKMGLACQTPTINSQYNQRPNGHIPIRPAANAPINIVLQYKDVPEQGAGLDRILSLRTPEAGGPRVWEYGKGVWQSRFYYSVEEERRDRHGRKLPRDDTNNQCPYTQPP